MEETAEIVMLRGMVRWWDVVGMRRLERDGGDERMC